MKAASTSSVQTHSVALALIVLSIVSVSISAIIENKAPQRGWQIVFAVDDKPDYPFSVQNIRKMRNYTEMIFGADTVVNRVVLNESRKRMNAMKQNKDTLNGIHFVMGEGATYNDFMKTINLCMERKPYSFAPYQNHIYAIYVNVPARK